MTGLEDAIEAYWNAESREEERRAYQRLRTEFGLPARQEEETLPELFDVASYDDYFFESDPAVSGNSGQEPSKEH